MKPTPVQSAASVLVLLCLSTAFGQAPEKLPLFAVATIKPAKAGDAGSSFSFRPDGFILRNYTLFMVLGQAYELQDNQIAAVPPWVKSAGFDIQARVDEPDRPIFAKLTVQQRMHSIQSLLADRFALKAHFEARELPVYNLVVSKTGPLMNKVPNLPDVAGNPTQGGWGTGAGRITGHALDMDKLVYLLSGKLHHTVLNKTALAGNYDFSLRYTPDEAPPSTESSAPSLFTAIQEQLGLKLEPGKAPIPVLIIDHVEPPTPD